ncbi:MAG: zinc ABC transporter substrate-binding protein [Sediminimonas sp.]|uniref:zinc ABC transporter substrate-binding protein n=1 Tax=Sediminimonas sp. TaxID=2823379 RepID=UPI0028700520|nr:zinc ABC transporter substrate-binding protein [Sediminimonas sp.]MDR9485454.1 zinc ABC transporter substrate-binding protein [Sediminimonas sp.]
MSMHRLKSVLLGIGAAMTLGAPGWAQAPGVATDIAAIHSLAARVMDGVGTPDLIIQQGASPHGYSLRPSEARALEQADVVFWVGEELTPWLDHAIESLAADARVVALLDNPKTLTREFREGATFEAHGHEDEHGPEDEHGHEDAHAHEDEHTHDGVDPHAWLDPENGKVWLDMIAAELSQVDPENAGLYFANAAEGKKEIDAVAAEVAQMLAPLGDVRFIVFHDAYQYFEARYNIPAAAAISLSDASDPSAARIAEIREYVENQGITCAFTEPQFNPGILNAVFSGTEAKTAVIDPQGTDIAPGPGFYPAFLRSVGQAIAGCL